MNSRQQQKAVISPDTTIQSVKLRVNDLLRTKSFYTHILGLNVLEENASIAHLGLTSGQLLVSLAADDAASPRPRATTGLYHFAFLMPDRQQLALALERLLANDYPLQGAADHYVSEAVYLADPEGNGIEIYADRARDQWYTPQGEIRMGTIALDVDDLLSMVAQADHPGERMPAGTRLGHIHLQVAHLQQAVAFYRDVLGFELMLEYGPSAAFLAAGGYHHHIGVNTWVGVGANRPPVNSTGLLDFTIRVPDQVELEAIADRLSGAEKPVEFDAGTLQTRDPSGIAIFITV